MNGELHFCYKFTKKISTILDKKNFLGYSRNAVWNEWFQNNVPRR